MPDSQFEGFEDLSAEPIEVSLVDQTTRCRACDWFWRPPPYGPYPSFDFTEDFPPVLRERTSHQFADKEYVRSVPGQNRRLSIVNPQLLHGCRKAPIMTIGINPNLTAFWPTTQGARWAYPTFSNFARYAYYYRHRTTHQESFPLDFIKSHVRVDGALKARMSGRIQRVSRDMVNREMIINIEYANGEVDTHHRSWDVKNHFVLLYDRSSDDVPQFTAGTVVGGFIDLPDGVDVSIEQNVVGYYQRVIPILEQVSASLRSRGHLPKLQMAEDVCQLDMVACASPGWGNSYQIDKQEVVPQCVQNNAWVVKQLIQSNPKVIVFSGRSAFRLFNQIFKPYVEPDLWDDMDVYGLLKMTSRDPHYLDISVNTESVDYHLRARLVISPHFSYDDNFFPHARFSEEDWEQFEASHPAAVADLKAQDRVTKPNRDNYRGISVDNFEEFQAAHSVATITIMQRMVDPSALIGQGIAQEIAVGNLTFNGDDGHLHRSAGSCRFCVNSSWTFPEGCGYNKDQEQPMSEGDYDQIFQQVLEQLEDGA